MTSSSTPPPPPRPPLMSPAGCFMSNTMGSIFGMLGIAFGALAGGEIGRMVGGEAGGLSGAQFGFVSMGILAFFTPWRRTVLSRVRKWQQRRAMRELGLTEGDDPQQFRQ